MFSKSTAKKDICIIFVIINYDRQTLTSIDFLHTIIFILILLTYPPLSCSMLIIITFYLQEYRFIINLLSNSTINFRNF